jgi:hypothetical protein
VLTMLTALWGMIYRAGHGTSLIDARRAAARNRTRALTKKLLPFE